MGETRKDSASEAESDKGQVLRFAGNKGVKASYILLSYGRNGFVQR